MTMEALMNLMKNSLEQSEGGQAVFCDYVVNALEVRIRIWDRDQFCSGGLAISV